MSGMLEPQERVAREIAGLARLDRQELVERWEKAFGRPPPRKTSRVLIEKALACEIQCKAFGGLPRRTRQALRNALSSDGVVPPRRALSPGARLIREWNGRTHQVEVIEGGFLWQGRTWRSLSRIAREITGTAWSGPRFFGLTGKR